MKLNDVGTVIGTRQLSLSAGKEVTVLLGKPEKFPDSEDWYCPYQIVGLGNGRVRYAAGIDTVQALGLALKMIGADLDTSKEAQAKELTWQGGDDLGFPVPNVLSDLPPARP